EWKRAEPEGILWKEEGEGLVVVKVQDQILLGCRVRTMQGPSVALQSWIRLLYFVGSAGQALLPIRERTKKEIVGEVNRNLSQTRDRLRRLEIILATCTQLIGCDNGEISLWDPEEPDWLKVVARFPQESRGLPYQVCADRGLTGKVRRSGQAAILPRTADDPAFRELLDVDHKEARCNEQTWAAFQRYLKRIKA